MQALFERMKLVQNNWYRDKRRADRPGGEGPEKGRGAENQRGGNNAQQPQVLLLIIYTSRFNHNIIKLTISVGYVSQPLVLFAQVLQLCPSDLVPPQNFLEGLPHFILLDGEVPNQLHMQAINHPLGVKQDLLRLLVDLLPYLGNKLLRQPGVLLFLKYLESFPLVL